MMNDNMKLVLKALRSGKYTQTTGALQDRTGYCCLGVMCDIYEKVTGEGVRRYPYNFIEGGNLTKHPQVEKWVGLMGPFGGFMNRHKGYVSLAGLNDNGSTFSQIADFIESEPEGLLV
jgi:hypothetical protein